MFSNELEKFIPDLRAYARVLSGDPSRADDIVQNACLNAWQKRDQFDGSKGPLRGWLFRIVRNEFYQQKRADRVREADPIDQMESEPVAACDLEKRSELNRMLQAVESLKTAQRDAFLLVAAAGFTYEEAGDVLECSPGTVKSRVSRAREMAFGRYHSEEWDTDAQPAEGSPLKQLHEALNRIQSVPRAA
ncbi:MAG: sigma-70 family RNA polymerase sigma factor [Henriciella sp.]